MRELKVFVDTAPVMEKPLARGGRDRLAGQAHQSRQPEHGSWLFLGVDPHQPGTGAGRPAITACIAVAAALPRSPARPAPSRPAPDRCAALHFLPHDRTSRPDPARFRRGDGQPHLRLRRLPCRLPVEPLRRRAAANRAFLPRAELAAPGSPTCWRSTMRLSARCSPGSPIKRIGRNRMIRNCLIAAGNSGDHDCTGDRAAPLDDDPVVADAARGRWISSAVRAARDAGA